MKVYMLLDRSGSMATLWNEALGSINGYVKGLKGRTKIFVGAFDSVEPLVVLRETTLSKWKDITSEDVMPRGGTPLNDAAGKVLDQMFDEKPKKAILVIMTDGYENASKEYTKDAIKAKIKLAKDKGYETVFLGANFDKIEDFASGYGVDKNRTMNITRSNLIDTMGQFSTATMGYFSADEDGGVKLDASFSAESKARAVKE